MNNSIYIGSTKDLKRRVERHNNGSEFSTKRYMPWELIYYEAFNEEKNARTREHNLKHNGNATRELKKRIGIDGWIKSGAGFTLVELVAGMSIIIISATAVVLLLSSSFRISNKTTSLASVRESGNNAINLMQRTIQFANGFSGASNDGTNYDASCPTSPTPYSYIRIRTSTGATQEFSCSSGHLYYDKGSGDVDLIDTSKVNITSCQLTCAQVSSDIAPVIAISFTIALKTTSSLPEQNASLSFSTSAKMRNL